MKKSIRTVLITFALLYFALVQNTRAVSPPPDGGYAGGNTAEGQNALQSLISGGFNSAVGYFSLFANTTGSFNTAVGAGALDLNSGDNNTATGAAALLLNTTGNNNTANGVDALVYNDTGSHNTADGAFALFSNTVGSQNTAIGDGTLFRSTDGTDNTAIGFQALYNNRPFNPPPSGHSNTASGSGALFNNAIGNFNTATGAAALFVNTTGNNNTALGYLAGNNVTTANNVICIGANVAGDDVDNSCFIGGISGADATAGDPVFVTSNGKLGTVNPSSARLKEEIKPMNKASEAILSLKPVTFHYKKKLDPKGIPQFGLVAEEVEKVNPDLVKRDGDGKLQTVRYDAVNAMLLNEFLKEHRKNEKQEATIARLEKQVEALSAGLQKVSDQLELSKPAPRTVGNNQ